VEPFSLIVIVLLIGGAIAEAQYNVKAAHTTTKIQKILATMAN
jgi:hypothetical protein